MTGLSGPAVDRLDRPRAIVPRPRAGGGHHRREATSRPRPFAGLPGKLTAPGIFDRAEEEATHVANVLSSGSRFGGDRSMDVRAPGSGAASVPATPSVRRGLSSPWQPLDPSTRAFYESRLGHDFSQVRVHVGPSAAASARAVSARAYTTGRDIVMGEGQFDPGTADGRRLLGHELTHVVQQDAGGGGSAGAVQRQASPELERIRDYLSYGLFDWVVRDAEAIAALELLKGLPRIQQAEFVSDAKYLERLRSNLPTERAAELETIVQDVAGMAPPRADLEKIIDNLSYGLFDWAITDAEAIEALELLKQLPPSQLAVALSRIDYGRLMDNLPEQRRKELIDLLARGLGPGGTREVSESSEPGFALKSLAFRSDHGVMKKNSDDWEPSGDPYPDPEWKALAPHDETVAISHTKDRNIDVELAFDVVPLSAAPAPVSIEGESDVDFLRFSHSGTEAGGVGKRLPLRSVGKLPDEVTAARNRFVTWKVKWGTWEHEVGKTGPFDIFVTVSDPARPASVTTRRMAKAVELVSDSPTLDPHTVVKTIAFNWTRFNLDVQYENPWNLADDMEKGAQCIDLVRFVDEVIATVGLPGTARAVVVWAKPTSAFVAEERPWPHGGMSSGEFGPFPGQPTWSAALLDGDWRPNNYEAAMKFTDGGSTLYYPGGVRIVVATAGEVLHVFKCLAWVAGVGGGEYEIKNVPATYRPPPPAVGDRHHA